MIAQPSRRPVALTIAGSDSSGGAGIQADLKTFTVLGVYGASVLTALTAQNTMGVSAVHPVPPAFISAQIAAVAGDLTVAAAKTGMIGGRDAVAAVAGAISRYRLQPLVVDPVMIATSGDPLIAPDAIAELAARLLPMAALITPNLPEAARLLGRPEAKSVEECEQQAVALLALGPAAVLVKGGHGSGGKAVDVLATRDGLRHFARPRIETRNTHGTGCTLSAAITAELAKGAAMAEAVGRAKEFVWSALEAGRDLNLGQGSGPVDHLAGIDPPQRKP